MSLCLLASLTRCTWGDVRCYCVSVDYDIVFLCNRHHWLVACVNKPHIGYLVNLVSIMTINTTSEYRTKDAPDLADANYVPSILIART